MQRPLSPVILAVWFMAIGAGAACAQTSGLRSFRSLSSAVSQAEATATREIHIQWTTAPSPPGAPALQAASAFRLLSQRRTGGGLRRERRPELSADRLVVVVRNGEGRELDWRIVADPKIVRAEVPGPDGQLTGRVIEQDSAELMLEIPDLAGADRIQIYRPVWNGREFNLDPLAQVYIGDGR